MSKKVFAVMSLSLLALVACSKNTASVTNTEDVGGAESSVTSVAAMDNEATSQDASEDATASVTSEAAVSSVAAAQ